MLAELLRLDVDALDRAGVGQAVGWVSRVRGSLDVVEGRLNRHLHHLAEKQPSILPDADVAAARHTSRRDAERASARAATLGEAPTVEAALAAGEISADHVDALGRALRNLEPNQREALAGSEARLAAIAARTTPEQFAKRLRLEAQRLATNGEETGAIEQLERQRRAARLRWWTDDVTGMLCLRGEFDPETGLRLVSRIERAVETMFHGGVPETSPTGEGRQDHLRAVALAHLLDSARSTVRPNPNAKAQAQADSDLHADPETDQQADPDTEADGDQQADPDADGDMAFTDFMRAGDSVELCVLIDLQTILQGLHERSIIDNGHDLQLPIASYRRMACQAAIIPMVLDGNGAVLDHGRTRRLASRQQRRALLAMYETCGIPGCRVAARHCEPHHVRWWRHFGRTDLDNLLPVCSRHHHALHEGGWHLVLRPDRSLTITFPDGTVQTTGPPQRRAA